MIQIQSHKPTTAELFPYAYQQDLLKKQSEHFVSKSITNGNFESGYENIPFDFPSSQENLPLVVNSKPPQLLIGTYFKHHWRSLLFILFVGGVTSYVYLKLKEKKDKEEKKSDGIKSQKKLFYDLPKKSTQVNKHR